MNVGTARKLTYESSAKYVSVMLCMCVYVGMLAKAYIIQTKIPEQDPSVKSPQPHSE